MQRSPLIARAVQYQGRRFIETMAEVKGAKKTLRAQVKRSLALLDPDTVVSQSRRAQEKLLTLAQYQQAKSLSVYLSMPTGEASTDLIVRDALQAGKAVFVPHMYKSAASGSAKPAKYMDMLRLDSLDDYISLEKDNWGIPTLPGSSIAQRENAMGGRGLASSGSEPSAGELDMILMPAVAFDLHMRRLGHGAGYYDSFLSRYIVDAGYRKPLLVGLCLAEQVLPAGDDIPVTDFDWSVDMVIAGDGRSLSQQ
ncbi:hypothetical protein AMS68_006475 [Peltaster fructicola]|uniref:5-formyltetrahydrofolate cyclo-ligase n=1 Tax=Peltaster fructicola TaxID=286661 RepID=A0A6H0Y285_9PEZI|nr:hypothetical protein AMS68_006475 [Peltaster fructicola]